MNEIEQTVMGHYSRSPDLLTLIRENARGPDGGLAAERLSMMDEFHVGSAAATDRLLHGMALPPGARLLDIGSGIGGPARHAAREGAIVTGIDLTPGFVATASALTAELGFPEGAVTFREGSALDLPFRDASFDAAMMLHVGMNIADKRALMAEVMRVLRPGGSFTIYDMMRVDAAQPGDGLEWPLPWADGPDASFLASDADYRAAAEATGFVVEAVLPRRAEAEAFFAEMKARLEEGRSAGAPPPPSIATLMGPEAPGMIARMIAAVAQGRIAPVELHLRKPATG